jgi:hypothetical protein
VHDTKAMSFLRFGIQPKLVDSRFRELLREENIEKFNHLLKKDAPILKENYLRYPGVIKYMKSWQAR